MGAFSRHPYQGRLQSGSSVPRKGARAGGHDAPRHGRHGRRRRLLRQDPGQHRAGHRGQDGRGPPGPGRAPGRGAPADRGRPRGRQDDAGQGPGPLHRLLGPPHPVHPRPAALRRHRGQRVQPGAGRLRVQAGGDLRQHRPRRRDQPGLPQDPGRPARVHGGAPGDRGRGHLPARGAVHGDRHPEPDRARGHLSPARGPAGPLHAGAEHRLPDPPGRDRDPGDPRPDHHPAQRPAAGGRRADGGRDDRGGQDRPRRRHPQALHRRPGQGDPRPRRPGPRGQPQGRPGPAAGGHGRRGRLRARLRGPRRRQGAGHPGAGPPADHRPRGPDDRPHRRRRPGRHRPSPSAAENRARRAPGC